MEKVRERDIVDRGNNTTEIATTPETPEKGSAVHGYDHASLHTPKALDKQSRGVTEDLASKSDLSFSTTPLPLHYSRNSSSSRDAREEESPRWLGDPAGRPPSRQRLEIDSTIQEILYPRTSDIQDQDLDGFVSNSISNNATILKNDDRRLQRRLESDSTVQNILYPDDKEDGMQESQVEDSGSN
eukprot:UC4_evm1s478